MSLTTLEVNLKDMGSTPEGVEGFRSLYDGLEERPDFVFIAEAYSEAKGLSPDLETFAAMRGLRLAHEHYNDREDIRDRHGWVALAVGAKVVHAETVYMADAQDRAQHLGRTAVRVRMRDDESGEDVDIFGAHFSDRSAVLNRQQAAALVAQADPARPTVLALQTNSMRRWGLWQPALRLAGRVFNNRRQADPGQLPPESLNSLEGHKWIPARVASLSARLGGMAEGLSYALLKREGFHSDSPIRQRATVHVGKVPIGKVDHIWVRNANVATYKPLRNILTPDMNRLRRVPHRVTMGKVSVPRRAVG